MSRDVDECKMFTIFQSIGLAARRDILIHSSPDMVKVEKCPSALHLPLRLPPNATRPIVHAPWLQVHAVPSLADARRSFYISVPCQHSLYPHTMTLRSPRWTLTFRLSQALGWNEHHPLDLLRPPSHERGRPRPPPRPPRHSIRRLVAPLQGRRRVL